MRKLSSSGAWRKLHLWLGVLFGVFFVVLGLTGSVLAWRDELDRALNPDLLQTMPVARRIDAAQVQRAVERLSGATAYGRPTMLVLPEHADGVLVAWYRQPDRQVMLDPHTLSVLGERNWEQAGLSRRLLMPTIYHVHRYFLAGEIGKTVSAIVGLGLTVAALSGLALWWPKRTLAALWAAVTVRHGGSWSRFAFRLHRSAGMFAAPFLLLLAFSGIYFNKPGWIVPAVTPSGRAVNRSANGYLLPPARVVEIAQAAFPSARVSRLSLPSKQGDPYEVRLGQAFELRHGDGATRMIIDSGDGAVLRVSDPHTARGADKLLGALFPLHSGEAFGIAGRIFISGLGLVPLLLFVSGLLMWSRRCLARRRGQAS